MEKCSLCNRIFLSQKEFKAHMSIHVNQKDVCHLCGEKFPSSEYLQLHLKTHLENHGQTESCLVCGGLFSFDEYKNHIKIHLAEPSFEKFSISDKLLPPDELQGHLKQDVEENLEVCSVCNCQFPSYELKDHIKSHEIENQNGVESSSGPSLKVKGTLQPAVYRILESCKVCHQLFDSKVDLKVHMNMHDVEIPQNATNTIPAVAADVTKQVEINEKCLICGIIFTSEEDLKSHVKSHTDGNGLMVWKCDTCDQTFYTQGAFKNHIHDPISSYLQCLVCKKNFSETKHFELHQRIHYLEKELKSKYKLPAEERPFVCSICNKSFALQKQLDAHKRIHVLEKKFFKCTVCGLKFTRPDILKSHLETHVVANFFVCKICEKTFARADLLLQHVKTHDDLKKCSHCGQMVSDLEAHVKQHHSQESFICGLCGAKFAECWKLEVHMKYHAEQESKKCDICPKGFMSETELTDHLSTHKSNDLPDLKDPSIRHKCYICCKIFVSEENLTDHMETHRNDAGVYDCKVCNMVFRSLFHLQDHMRSHSNDRPFTCKVCGRYYKYQNSLLYHEKTHKGEGSFVCKCCSKRFYRFTELFKHTQRMHPGVQIVNKSEGQRNRLKKQKNPSINSPSKQMDRSQEFRTSFHCRLCDEDFLCGQVLRFHRQKNHDWSRKLSHKCIFCKKLFKSLLSLKFHVGRLHKADVRKKKLSQGKQTSRKGKCIRPSHTAADQDSEFSFTCGVCGNSFLGCDELTEHIELSHMVSE